MSWMAIGILVKDSAEGSRDGGGERETQLCLSSI